MASNPTYLTVQEIEALNASSRWKIRERLKTEQDELAERQAAAYAELFEYELIQAYNKAWMDAEERSRSSFRLQVPCDGKTNSEPFRQVIARFKKVLQDNDHALLATGGPAFFCGAFNAKIQIRF
jgi:hypothetical protein